MINLSGNRPDATFSSIKPKQQRLINNKTIVVYKHFCKIEMVDIVLENGQSRQKMKMAES